MKPYMGKEAEEKDFSPPYKESGFQAAHFINTH